MNEHEYDLYVGIPEKTSKEKMSRFVDLVNKRHPDSVLIAVVDGYWSGPRENTYHIKVKCTLQDLKVTASIIQSILNDGFVAIDGPDN